MKKFTLLVAVLIIVEFTTAQITFQKTFGIAEIGMSVQQTVDGGYIVTGSTSNLGAGNVDIYLIKTNANGDSLWTRTFGGTSYDIGNSVQQTTDGGYIIAGYTNSFGAGDYDVYVIKIDSNGNLLWTKTFGGTGDDRSYSIQQTTDGDYIIAGYSNSFGSGGEDIYLIKTDANGNLLWTKTFGGTMHDLGKSVQLSMDGGYIITGFTASFGVGATDVYLIKTDSSGNLIWAKTFGGALADYGNFVRQTVDSGYIVTGVTTSFGAGNWDVYLIKTDANGDSLWTKTMGGGTNDEGGNSIQQTTDGGYIIAGYTNSFGAGSQDGYLIKTNVSGNPSWTITFGGSGYDNLLSIQQTNDGGYVITGYSPSFGSNSSIYLIKTDSIGNSGCNQGNAATIATTPATQVTNPATIVTSPPTIETTPATIVGSGGIVTTLCTNVGINEIITDNSFLISPNPSSGTFTINFPETFPKGKIEIYNVLEERIYMQNIIGGNSKEIHLTNIHGGIYFVKVFDGEKSFCKKLIIE